MKKHTVRNLSLFCLLSSLTALSGCLSDSDKKSTAPSVVPPSSSKPLSLLVAGSVVDSVSENVVGPVTLKFMEKGVPSTNVLDVNGNAITQIVSEDGSFTFTLKEGASVDALTITAAADGYLRGNKKLYAEQLSGQVNVLLDLTSKSVAGVSSQTATAAVSNGLAGATIDVATSGADGQVRVVIPPTTEMRKADGSTISGTSVQVSLSHVALTPSSSGAAATASQTIPEGLNESADSLVDLPVGVFSIEMLDNLGNKVKQFSAPITLTLNIPASTKVPGLNRTVQQGDTFNIRSYDEDSGEWAQEPSVATLGALNTSTNSYPASFSVDHLTFFTLSRSTPTCNQDITAQIISGTVPSTGLYISMTTTDASVSSYLRGGVTSRVVVSGATSARYGISATATASVRVSDAAGNNWFRSAGEVPVCGAFDVALTSPFAEISQNVTLTATCSNNAKVSTKVTGAALTYAEANKASTLAQESGDGIYQLGGLKSGQSYTVKVDSRVSGAQPLTTTIVADGTAKTIDVPVQCSTSTGGTGAVGTGGSAGSL